jgi:hypothetical protein
MGETQRQRGGGGINRQVGMHGWGKQSREMHRWLYSYMFFRSVMMYRLWVLKRESYFDKYVVS